MLLPMMLMAVMPSTSAAAKPNPFYEHGGCLRAMQQKLKDSDESPGLGALNNLAYQQANANKTTSTTKQFPNMRVCNSNDNAVNDDNDKCLQSPLSQEHYTEVRFAAQSWESNYVSVWLLQILLSELLQVPTTVEKGHEGNEMDFYFPGGGAYEGGSSGDYFYGELVTASHVKDCRTVLATGGNTDEYTPCFHVVPEVWWADRFGDRSSLPGAEPTRELGALGYQSFYATKMTITRDPSLVSYLGLQGSEGKATPASRRKLAETFKRPVTFAQYCQEISSTNCTTPDDTAARPPNASTTEEEGSAYFVPNVYTGHFRYTDQNNCTLNPNTCTGFFADFPCGWASFAQQQLYHNGIALESSHPTDEARGYNGKEMRQLYAAANATKSNLMVYWFDIGTLFHTYLGTDVEPTRIVFPEPTQACLDHRIDPSQRCGLADGSTPQEDLVGDPLGKCAATTTPLKKVMGTALKDISYDKDTAEALWSPAYEVIQNFQISSQQLGQIIQQWVIRVREQTTEQNNESEIDLSGLLALREVTCEWAVEHLDLLESFVPESHPRILQSEDVAGSVLFTMALVMGSLGILLVVLFGVVTVVKRNTTALYYAQPQFIAFFLLGLGFVSVGSILMATPPTDVSCVAIAWMINIGYAIHLVPLLVRINAINNLAFVGKQMQRVRLKLGRLKRVTSVIVMVVGAYLVVWMVIDRPAETFQFEVTETVTENGETVITSFDYCGSSFVWYYISYAWRALLILPATMIAFMSLQVLEDLNDTRQMSRVLLLHTITLIVVSTMSGLMDDRSTLMGWESLVMSLDVLLSIVVYILPKFVKSGEVMQDEPLPDVFVGTTIAVIEVVGFTAWSSVREPVLVFQFLEEWYECMDSVAEKYHIFKVLATGESYVAASGIPKPRNDHCVIMCKFAKACMTKVSRLSKDLEIKYGPDTADLMLRIGLHSGSVTGGFMKGKGDHFQLVGDTMTTATLIQRTCMNNQIQLSEETANELTRLGKKKWITPRSNKLITKEKGEIQTYILTTGSMDEDFTAGSGSFDDFGDTTKFASVDDSKERWIQWNVETFKSLLEDIVARRGTALGSTNEICKPSATSCTGDMPLDEVVEIIELPKFDRRAARRQRENITDVELSSLVMTLLKDYISEVAAMYNDNPFHNFAHASYVVMAVVKYMNRIKAAYEIDTGNNLEDKFRSANLEAVHKHTHGVASDPLTLFAVVFSALIHDVDHPGVPNPQLIKENKEAATKYKNRSVAEQRSLDLAWGLLMEDRFRLLRSTICCNEEELGRFRQLVINAVMATDLGDKQLKELRNSRWDKAFSAGVTESCVSADDTESISRSLASSVSMSSSVRTPLTPSITSPIKYRRDGVNRKATIVIEHLIQAADVAHMSQHWDIYRKWNERLFRECYKAYREGRAESNPADSWYKGDIGFFDFYIIPLSKKLRDCGVFGPTSDENLNYATNNRNQWVREGVAITAAMLKQVEFEYDSINANIQEQPAPSLAVGNVLNDILEQPGDGA